MELLPHDRWKGLLAGGLLLALSACSTAEYAAPIQTFKASADAAAQSFANMNETLAATTLDYAVQSAAGDPQHNQLLRQEEDCGAFNPVEEVRCRAFFRLQSTAGPSVDLQRNHYTDPLGGILAVLNATQAYAGNLAAVQSADTISQVNDSIDSIQANLIQLSKAANVGQASDLPEAAGQAIKWAFGQYIESVKYNALKAATAAARKPLSDAREAVREMEVSAKIILTASTEKAARDSILNMNPNSAASIRATLAAQNAYDDLLTAPLSSMFDNLVDAHDGLADGFGDGSHLSVRQALAKMDDVLKQAATLEKIARDLQAALND